MFCELPNFGRCCFCLPLRQGILTFAYLNIIVSSLMVTLYCHLLNKDYGLGLMYHGSVSDLQDEVCIAIYLVDIVFNIVLVYGAHMKHLLCLKTFYYYTLCTCLATVLLQILGMISNGARDLESIPLFVVGICLHIYLLFLVRSLLKKLEASGGIFENQLEQFINGDAKIEENDV